MKLYDAIHALTLNKAVVSAYALDSKGVAAAVAKMAFGNKLGVNVEMCPKAFFANGLGNIVAEVAADKLAELEAVFAEADLEYTVIGKVTENAALTINGEKITMEEALQAWTSKLEKVFPTKAVKDTDAVASDVYKADSIYVCKNKVAKPTVFIPVFPGTNCEYDSTKAFERAGANVITKVFKNMTAEDIRASVAEFEKAIADPIVVHFTTCFLSGTRPWIIGDKHRYQPEFIKYRNMTGWKDDPLWKDNAKFLKKVMKIICLKFRIWTIGQYLKL